MEFSKVTNIIIAQLVQMLGEDLVFFDKESLLHYSKDETEDLVFEPEVVLKPENTQQVAAILKFCNQEQIAVTVRGAGTGLSGGALPVYGGVLIAMERFNQILAIDLDNLQATVEPGVVTEHLIDAVAAHGLLYPVDPASKGSCFIGGNVSHGSGGPRVLKYGTIREYILNLEVVLASGEIMWTSSNTLKFASGYNLTQLFIGSEGTLGVITKIVLKLIPKPSQSIVLWASFDTNEGACKAVASIFKAGITPSALEYMERKGVDWVIQHDQIHFPLESNEKAFLLIELSGNELELLYQEGEKVNEVLESNQCINVLLADSAQQKADLWKIRTTMAVSVKSNSIYKEEDTVVPRAFLPPLIAGIKAIGAKYGFESICYGHAGDGNLHVNILKGTMSDEAWNVELKQGIIEIFELTVSLGGTISGEHGIGWVQKEYMTIKFSQQHLALMKGIKQVFDVKGILNPGKIF